MSYFHFVAPVASESCIQNIWTNFLVQFPAREGAVLNLNFVLKVDELVIWGKSTDLWG